MSAGGKGGEGREGEGVQAFSTSALWKLSVGKYLSTRITQHVCKVLNKVKVSAYRCFYMAT